MPQQTKKLLLNSRKSNDAYTIHIVLFHQKSGMQLMIEKNRTQTL